MKGFSLVEVLVSVGVLVLIGITSLTSFVSYQRKEALDKNTAKIEALLEQARSMTLSSKDDTQYGVHIESGKLVLFQGNAYSPAAATNLITNLPGSVIASTTLSGGGNDIIFDRIQGTTNEYGTTTLSLTAQASSTKSIIIYKTGLIERY